MTTFCEDHLLCDWQGWSFTTGLTASMGYTYSSNNDKPTILITVAKAIIMSFSLYMSLKIKSCHAHKNTRFLPTMPIVSDQVSSFSECTRKEWQFQQVWPLCVFYKNELQYCCHCIYANKIYVYIFVCIYINNVYARTWKEKGMINIWIISLLGWSEVMSRDSE